MTTLVQGIGAEQRLLHRPDHHMRSGHRDRPVTAGAGVRLGGRRARQRADVPFAVALGDDAHQVKRPTGRRPARTSSGHNPSLSRATASMGRSGRAAALLDSRAGCRTGGSRNERPPGRVPASTYGSPAWSCDRACLPRPGGRGWAPASSRRGRRWRRASAGWPATRRCRRRPTARTAPSGAWSP